VTHDTNNWEQDSAEALKASEDKSLTQRSLMGDTKETDKGTGKSHRPCWRRAETLLFAAPLLFICLVFASPIFNRIRDLGAPPKRNYATSSFKDGRTPAERISIDRQIREQEVGVRIAEQDYQRRLATWRFFFVVLPGVLPKVALGLLLIGGVVGLFIRARRHHAPRSML